MSEDEEGEDVAEGAQQQQHGWNVETEQPMGPVLWILHAFRFAGHVRRQHHPAHQLPELVLRPHAQLPEEGVAVVRRQAPDDVQQAADVETVRQ